ncbi:hypothetical protein A8E62_18355 [Burkholderia cenocepacia]|nr:hypothetical protein A8E62_18355 [Burkholderia cenocepacia]
MFNLKVSLFHHGFDVNFSLSMRFKVVCFLIDLFEIGNLRGIENIGTESHDFDFCLTILHDNHSILSDGVAILISLCFLDINFHINSFKDRC